MWKLQGARIAERGGIDIEAAERSNGGREVRGGSIRCEERRMEHGQHRSRGGEGRGMRNAFRSSGAESDGLER